MLIVLIVAIAIGLAVVMAATCWLVVTTGKSGWVDVIWSYAVGLAAITAALGSAGPSPRAPIVAIIAAMWSLRLGTHILLRTLKGGDDPRYAKLKADWGDSYRVKLLGFLEIQAAVALILALSAMVAALNPAPLGLNDVLGIIIAIVAIAGEALSDAQLTAFRRDPANKGRICDTGLWSLSRHPNYFFEWLAWVAYPVIAIGHWWGLLAWAAPVMMYFLLVKVSGIPPLEAHMLQSRPEAFRAYQTRVHAFFPLPKASRS